MLARPRAAGTSSNPGAGDSRCLCQVPSQPCRHKPVRSLLFDPKHSDLAGRCAGSCSDPPPALRELSWQQSRSWSSSAHLSSPMRWGLALQLSSAIVEASQQAPNHACLC